MMAIISEHKKDCKHLLDKEYTKIHEFLDRYAQEFPVNKFFDYHRTFLHNSYGLRIIRDRWGYKAYLAGCIHLYRDYSDVAIRIRLNIVIERMSKVMIYFNNPTNSFFFNERREYAIKAY